MAEEQKTIRSREEEGEELDLEIHPDLDGAMRDAVAAVEELETARQGRTADRLGSQGEAASDEVEALRREVEELRDRSIRTLAEFDNFRKRSLREREEVQRYAATGLMREFVEVVDNLERALAAGGAAEDLKVGIEMILRQTQDILRRHGVSEVPAVGEAFDPNLHEAVAREEDPAVQSATVRDQLQRGYRIHDRLLRPAKVRVAVPSEVK